MQLEQYLNVMTMRIDLKQKEIQNKSKTEEIYNEILTGFDCLSQIDNDEFESGQKSRSESSNTQPKTCTNLKVFWLKCIQSAIKQGRM